MNRFMVGSVPLVTLSIAVAGMAATYIPEAGRLLVYNRTAIIHGDIWRVVSGQFYHYSSLHLWSNLLPLVVVGAWVERQTGSWFLGGCLLMATLIGICLFLVHPFMLRFGGLSGMVCGLMTHFGLTAVRQAGGIRVLGRIVLVVLFLKIGYEIVTGEPWLADWDGHGFIVMPLSHLAGMLTAVIWVVLQTVTSSAGMTCGRPERI